MCYHNRAIYTHLSGGAHNGARATTETFNLKTSTYSSAPSLPRSMYSCTVSKRLSTNIFYFTGGALRGVFYKNVYSYNPESKLFTELPNKMLTPRARHGSHVYEDGNVAKLVVSGGYTTGWAWTNTVEMCDLSSSSGTWSYGQALPDTDPWRFLTMDDMIHAYKDNPNRLYKYDEGSDQWTQRYIQQDGINMNMRTMPVFLNIEDVQQYCQLI